MISKILMRFPAMRTNFFSPMFRSRSVYFALLGCLVLGALVAISRSRAAEPAPNTGTRQSVLVLKSGRVVDGRISQAAGGFLVEVDKGRMLIPFDLVKIQADDRRDAYTKSLETLPRKRSADSHMTLARWCFSYQLIDEAKSELRKALELDPASESARRLLVRIEKTVTSDSSSNPNTLRKKQAKISQVAAKVQTDSLAGLSNQTIRMYLTKVQPILMKRCAGGGCHGPVTKSKFSMIRVRLGRRSRRAYSEQNLAKVLNYVDLKRPIKSPLLTVPEGKHGRGNRDIFSGTRDAHLLKILRTWVRRVSRDAKDRQSNKASQLVGRKATGSANHPAAEETSTTFIRGRREKFDKGNAPNRQSIVPLSKDDLLKAVVLDERFDPFDPEVFNRAVHGHESRQRQVRRSRIVRDHLKPAANR